MKLYIFGSCSGTEPMPNRHHTALALEINSRIYWFDAGENCSHTAHLMGVDLLSVSDIFISHPHIDHTGGLCNLLWTIRKLCKRSHVLPRFGSITVHTPGKECFDAVLNLLKVTASNYENDYRTLHCCITDGVLLEDENIKVTAVHNRHIPYREIGWRSYSFCIEAEGKKIVFSGDVKSLDDLAPFLDGGCDLLLMESGHHVPENICTALSGGDVKNLYFLHHGRAILNDYEGVLAKCRETFPSVVICNDGDVFEI